MTKMIIQLSVQLLGKLENSK